MHAPVERCGVSLWCRSHRLLSRHLLSDAPFFETLYSLSDAHRACLLLMSFLWWLNILASGRLLPVSLIGSESVMGYDSAATLNIRMSFSARISSRRKGEMPNIKTCLMTPYTLLACA